MMDSLRLKVSRSTITACFWFFASVIYFLGYCGHACIIPVFMRESIKELPGGQGVFMQGARDVLQSLRK